LQLGYSDARANRRWRVKRAVDSNDYCLTRRGFDAIAGHVLCPAE
jgi:hypothetical protein